MADNEKIGDHGGLKVDRNRDQPYASRVNEQRVIFKGKHRTDENGLPEPPPDPWACPWHARHSQNLLDATQNRNLEEDEDIISCLTYFGTSPFEGQTSECPSRNSVTSTMATSNVFADDVFEHLDRLYAFTKEILELRNRNAKFFKRVRNLERSKVLRTANQKLENAFMHDKDGTIDILDEDTGFAESLLDAMLSNCRDPPFQKWNVRSSSTRQGRSKLDVDKQPSTYQMSSSVPKVSKWTRVKAAFKWERACPNDPEIVDHSVPSTPTTTTIPTVPLSNWTAKCHRIPDTEIGEAKCASFSPYVNEVYVQRPFDQTSNAEFYDWPHRNVPHNLPPQSPKSDNGKSRGDKISRNQALDDELIAMGTEQVKNVEVTNEVNQRRSLTRIAPGKNRMLHSSSQMDEKDSEPTSKTPTPILTIRIPSREDDMKYTSSPESYSPLFYNTNISDVNSSQLRKTYQELMSNKDFKRQQSLVDESIIRASKMQRQDSKWNKVRRAFLTNSTLSVPSNLINNSSPKQMFLQDDVEASVSCNCNMDNVEDIEKLTRMNNRVDSRQDYQALRQKLGSEFHRKLTEWERVKNVSPHAKDSRENSSNLPSPRECLLSEDRLTPEFRKKLQDWKRVKKIRRGSAPFEQQRISRRRLTDWQLWRSPSKAENRNRETTGFRVKSVDGDSVGDGKSHMCEDFVRKMEAWRKTSESGYQDVKCPSPLSKTHGFVNHPTVIDETEFFALERLLSFFNTSAKRSPRECDMKQLDECFLGDTRFYTNGAQHENNPSDVLVRTSVGSYRFEGISREFTRKLYDWEKYRGISPTSSTFRLLGPAYTPFTRQTIDDASTIHPSITSVECDEPVSSKNSTLKRSKSVGSIVERRACKEFFLTRSHSLESLGPVKSNRFNSAGHIDNLAASIEPHAMEDIAEDTMDDSEPEAVIVDIEDVIEETASPLARVQPRQTPVYSVAASETTSIAVPLGTVTSSHEPSPIFFIEMDETAKKTHLSPKVCSRRKSFSSEESLSAEHFEVVSRHNSIYDDIELKHWSIATSLNEEIQSTNDTITHHLQQGLDKISVNSNGSICSSDLSSKSNITETLKVMTKSTDSNFIRKSEPVAELIDETSIENSGREHCSNDEETRLARCRYKRNLAGMDIATEADNQETQDDEIMTKHDNEYEEIIVNNNDFRYCSFENAHPVESSKEGNDKNTPNLSASRLTDNSNRTTNNEKYRYINRAVEQFEKFEDNYGIIRDDVYNTHYDTARIKVDQNTSEPPKSYSEYRDRVEEMIRSTGTVTSGRTMERSERQEFCNENLSIFSMLRARNSSISEDQSEPSIQTTAFTVAPNRQERQLDRIDNEDTLNKTVMLTAISGSSAEITVSNQLEDRSITENSAVKRQRRSSSNETPSDKETKKQPTNSPSRNVFMKTKRIIFSPFRRSEERTLSKKESCTIENDNSQSPKNRNKSRSASPKINRQDVLFRMSLSLPWPLRSSSKDREMKESSVEKCDEGKPMIAAKENFNRTPSMEVSETSSPGTNYVHQTRMNSRASPFRGRRSSDESMRKINQLRYSIEGNESSLKSSSSTLKSENDVNGTRPFAKSEPYSSDLMYKLNILSNAVAKRDGRENTTSGDSPLETHSLRVRRAKEDFLSNRGGPLCRSLIDSPPIKRDNFRRRATHYYEEIVENHEDVRSEGISNYSNRISSPAYVSGIRDMRQDSREGSVGQQFAAQYNELSNSSFVSQTDRIKSASVGMINVDPDTFERLMQTSRGCDSLPRTISKPRQTLGPIARIVGRFKFPRLIRGKDTGEEKRTIAKLCRQSLLIDIRNDFEKSWKNGNRT